MIFLKTYFYVEHELKFLKYNLIESFPHIEKFIVCEFNRTHTGMDKEFIGKEKVLESLPPELRHKILYLPLDLEGLAVEAYNREDLIHQINEPIMRSLFMKHIELNDDDIVVSVDADEIIYGDSYGIIKEKLLTSDVCSLNLHQFFYKENYLWSNKDFIAPTAAKYSFFKHKFPCNLRYEGETLPEKMGCHFSWCMTVDEMLYKLDTYSHPKYRFCSDRELLEDAIERKEYPFDRSQKFEIVEISHNSEILPKSMRS